MGAICTVKACCRRRRRIPIRMVNTTTNTMMPAMMAQVAHPGQDEE